MNEIAMPKLIIFASGAKDGGGSGFENLVHAKNLGILKANILGVVSNHPEGGVKARAERLGIPFFHIEPPWEAENYTRLLKSIYGQRTSYGDGGEGDCFVALSGWLKPVHGLDPRFTINIHPGPLLRFGGPGMYGIHVHEKVIEAHKKGELTHSAVTMHFVTKKYDEGPVFFRYPVPIKKDYSPEILSVKVNHYEHIWQPYITNMVIYREIGLRKISEEKFEIWTPKGYPFVDIMMTGWK